MADLVIAGNQAKWDAETNALPLQGTHINSALLCALQLRQSNAGYLPAEMVKSMFGWSVRYRSGLQDFGLLLAGGRQRMTLEQVVAWGKQWVAQDPARRVLLVREHTAKANPEILPFVEVAEATVV